MTNTLDSVIAWLNQLYGLPAATLVFASCIVLGYALRFVKRFPNDGIPVAVILWGGIAMSAVADARASNMSLRVWVVRNILVGMVIGMVAWLAHKIILSRVEDWIASKFGGSQDTTFFNKPNPPAPTPSLTGTTSESSVTSLTPGGPVESERAS